MFSYQKIENAQTEDYAVRLNGIMVGRVLLQQSTPRMHWSWSTYSYPSHSGECISKGKALNEAKDAIMSVYIAGAIPMSGKQMPIQLNAPPKA